MAFACSLGFSRPFTMRRFNALAAASEIPKSLSRNGSFQTFQAIIASNRINLDLKAMFLQQGWNGQGNSFFEVIVYAGVVISSRDPTIPAIIATGFPAGCLLFIRGLGPSHAVIQGVGGTGGLGGGDYHVADPGGQGGTAILSDRIPIAIDDTFLFVGGGGGGGGGGGVSTIVAPPPPPPDPPGTVPQPPPPPPPPPPTLPDKDDGEDGNSVNTDDSTANDSNPESIDGIDGYQRYRRPEEEDEIEDRNEGWIPRRVDDDFDFDDGFGDDEEEED